MGEKIAFENGRISDFEGLMTLTLTLNRVILHIPSCICRRPLRLYLHTKCHWNRRNILWTDGRTVRTDGHLRQALSGWLATHPLFVNRFRWNFIGTISCILGTNVYKVNRVDFRFDVITSFYDVIPPRHTRLELCYCQVPILALWFDIWNHINPVSAC